MKKTTLFCLSHLMIIQLMYSTESISLPDSLRMNIDAKSTIENPLFVCHAGYKVMGPPNSRPAITGAGIAGFWGCETDIRITSDGTVICFHDPSLDNTTNGIGKVNEMTYNEIIKYRLNDNSDKNTLYDYSSFTDDDLRILTIDEFLDICEEYRMVPVLDMKSYKAYKGTLDAIYRHNFQGKCILQSADIEQLKLVRQLGYNERIHLYWAHSSNIDQLLELGNASISFNITDLDADLDGTEDYGDYHPQNAEELIKMCNDIGLNANISGSNKAAIAKRMIGMGVSFIISDYLFCLDENLYPDIINSYVVYNDNTLQFFNDKYKYFRDGIVFDELEIRYSTEKWEAYKEEITTVSFDTSFSNAKPISTALWFNGFTKLDTIIGIENLNTSEVNTMYSMFNGCNKLKSMNLSSFDTAKVTDMSYMFNGCNSLNLLDLGNFDTTNVKNMNHMFSFCNSLMRLNLNSFNTSNVINMNFMFYSCSALMEIEVGEEWNTSNTTYSISMFNGCKNLMGSDATRYNKNVTDKMAAHTGTGGYLTGLARTYVVFRDSTLTFYYDNQCLNRTGTIYTYLIRTNSDDQWGLHKAEVKKVVFDLSFCNARSCTLDYWFSGCTSMVDIDGIEYLKTNSVTTMYAMFNICKSLTAIDLQGFDTSKVTNMGRLFNSCTKLTELNLSSFDTGLVSDMSYMFNSCSSIKSIEVGARWTTSNVINSNRMFSGCKKIMGSDATIYNENVTDKEAAHTSQGGYLTGPYRAYAVFHDNTLTFYYDDQYSDKEGTVYTYLIRSSSNDLWGINKTKVINVVFNPSFSNAHPNSLNYWFSGCYFLNNFEGIEHLNASSVNTMYALFNSCNSLITLDISYFDTHNVTDMRYMFCNCKLLKRIYVSGLWNTEKVNNSEKMFGECISIRGGNDNEYDSNYTDVQKAYVGYGGYLTDIADKEKDDADKITEIDCSSTLTSKATYYTNGISTENVISPKALPKSIYIIGDKKVIKK